VIDLLPSPTIAEAVNDLRDDFRIAFQDYLRAGERMTEILRSPAGSAPDRRIALQRQQAILNDSLRRYEEARCKYVDGVMGQLVGIQAMGLRS
jgi:hypothetical protein